MLHALIPFPLDCGGSLTKEWVLTDVADSSQLGTSERIKDKMVKLRLANHSSTAVTPVATIGREGMVMGDLEERVRSAEGKAREAEGRVEVTDIEARVVSAEERYREAEERVRVAEGRVREAEDRVREAEERVVGAERRATLAIREADERVSEAERMAEERVRGAERREVKRVGAAEGRARDAEERVRESERLIQEVRSQGEERAREIEHRAQASEERAVAAERDIAAERQWVVERREIHITEDVLGGGAWGEVKVAIFRGTKVAAKSHHQAIRPYYRHLFIREMNMASRIRHPNLVQFIGASMEDGMVILTELMSTSLRRELEREDYNMTADQLIVISLDVSKALNYLHQMQPDPVIHRDISSANVLLEPLPDQQWRAKVTDYGSVNFQQQLRTVGPGAIVYASPESATPSLQSPKMDIFSFGVLLVEMYTAEFPEVSARERLISSIRDPEWVGLIRRCTHQSGDDRPSADQIIAELQQRLDH